MRFLNLTASYSLVLEKQNIWLLLLHRLLFLILFLISFLFLCSELSELHFLLLFPTFFCFLFPAFIYDASLLLHFLSLRGCIPYLFQQSLFLSSSFWSLFCRGTIFLKQSFVVSSFSVFISLLCIFSVLLISKKCILSLWKMRSNRYLSVLTIHTFY